MTTPSFIGLIVFKSEIKSMVYAPINKRYWTKTERMKGSKILEKFTVNIVNNSSESITTSNSSDYTNTILEHYTYTVYYQRDIVLLCRGNSNNYTVIREASPHITITDSSISYYTVIDGITYNCMFIDSLPIDGNENEKEHQICTISDMLDGIIPFDLSYISTIVSIMNGYAVSVDKSITSVDKVMSSLINTWYITPCITKWQDIAKDSKEYDLIMKVRVSGKVKDTEDYPACMTEDYPACITEGNTSGNVNNCNIDGNVDDDNDDTPPLTCLNIPNRYNSIILAIRNREFDIDNVSIDDEVVKTQFDYLFDLPDMYKFIDYNDEMSNEEIDIIHGSIYNNDYPLTLNMLRIFIAVYPPLSHLVMHQSVRLYDAIWSQFGLSTVDINMSRGLGYKYNINTDKDNYKGINTDKYNLISLHTLNKKRGIYYIKFNWSILYAVDFASYNNADHESKHIIKFSPTVNNNITLPVVYYSYGKSDVTTKTFMKSINKGQTISYLMNFPYFRKTHYLMKPKHEEDCHCPGNMIITMLDHISGDSNTSESTINTVHNLYDTICINGKYGQLLPTIKNRTDNSSYACIRDYNVLRTKMIEQSITSTVTQFKKTLSHLSNGILDDDFAWNIFWLTGSSVYSIVSGSNQFNDFDLMCIVTPPGNSARSDESVKYLEDLCHKHIVTKLYLLPNIQEVEVRVVKRPGGNFRICISAILNNSCQSMDNNMRQSTDNNMRQSTDTNTGNNTGNNTGKDKYDRISFDVYYNTPHNVSMYHSDPTNAYYTGTELCMFPRFFIALAGYMSDVTPPISADVTTLRSKYMERYGLYTLWSTYTKNDTELKPNTCIGCMRSTKIDCRRSKCIELLFRQDEISAIVMHDSFYLGYGINNNDKPFKIVDISDETFANVIGDIRVFTATSTKLSALGHSGRELDNINIHIDLMWYADDNYNYIIRYDTNYLLHYCLSAMLNLRINPSTVTDINSVSHKRYKMLMNTCTTPSILDVFEEVNVIHNNITIDRCKATGNYYSIRDEYIKSTNRGLYEFMADANDIEYSDNHNTSRNTFAPIFTKSHYKYLGDRYINRDIL